MHSDHVMMTNKEEIAEEKRRSSMNSKIEKVVTNPTNEVYWIQLFGSLGATKRINLALYIQQNHQQIFSAMKTNDMTADHGSNMLGFLLKQERDDVKEALDQTPVVGVLTQSDCRLFEQRDRPDLPDSKSH